MSTISPVRTAEDLEAVRGLFRAYEASLDIDLAYQDFASELAGLPGKYAPPSGEILIAKDEQHRALGCVALRPLDSPERCEMKRLYVAPEGRGMGLGKALMQAIVETAKRTGYRQLWLDTLPNMAAAQTLYRSAGFEVAEPYYDTPVEGTIFLRLRLDA